MTTPVDSARRFYDALASGDAPPSATERADARLPTIEESTDRLAAPEQRC